MKIGDYIAILLVALVLAAGGLGVRAIYNAGVKAEAARWTAAQAKADREQQERQERAQASSEAATDDARAGAQQDSRETREATTNTIETIRYVYRTLPASGCRPDPVPDGVQDELRRAYEAAAAASR